MKWLTIFSRILLVFLLFLAIWIANTAPLKAQTCTGRYNCYNLNPPGGQTCVAHPIDPRPSCSGTTENACLGSCQCDCCGGVTCSFTSPTGPAPTPTPGSGGGPGGNIWLQNEIRVNGTNNLVYNPSNLTEVCGSAAVQGFWFGLQLNGQVVVNTNHHVFCNTGNAPVTQFNWSTVGNYVLTLHLPVGWQAVDNWGACAKVSANEANCPMDTAGYYNHTWRVEKVPCSTCTSLTNVYLANCTPIGLWSTLPRDQACIIANAAPA